MEVTGSRRTSRRISDAEKNEGSGDKRQENRTEAKMKQSNNNEKMDKDMQGVVAVKDPSNKCSGPRMGSWSDVEGSGPMGAD